MVKKRNGKINTSTVDEKCKRRKVFGEEVKIAKDLKKEDIDVKIEKMIADIKRRFSAENCPFLKGNEEKIPDTLYALWYARSTRDFAVDTLDENHRKYQQGKVSAAKFLGMLEKLLSSLTFEYASFMESFITDSFDINRKEDIYERT